MKNPSIARRYQSLTPEPNLPTVDHKVPHGPKGSSASPEIMGVHETLGAEIAVLRSRVRRAVQEGWATGLHYHFGDDLERLCARLCVHFQTEERGSSFEPLPSSAQRASLLTRLRRQHWEFLIEGERLTEALRTGLASPALLARVCWLLDLMTAHELEEQRLIQEQSAALNTHH